MIVWKGKSEFSRGEKQKLVGILPEKRSILRVKKLKTLFLSKITGGKVDSRGECSLPPVLWKKPWMY